MGELSRHPLRDDMQAPAPSVQWSTVPLTPAPAGLTVWRASSPWQTVRSMVGLVLVCFFIAQLSVFLVGGMVDGDFNGTPGPLEPVYTLVGGVCLAPLLLLFFHLRRPRLTHSVRAAPHPGGGTVHPLSGGLVVQAQQPVEVRHHVFRSNAPLEMPRPLHLWGLFVGGVTLSTVCLLPLSVFGVTPLTVLLGLMVVLPAWLVGFAAPVFGWWSITSRHMGITVSRRDAEWMLAAGMLSTIPAIVINSLISPIGVHAVGLDAFEPGSWGEGMILFISAPVGEELSKAFAVVLLGHLIVSPKHGFYVGSTVGLGFALLENAQYIFMALLSEQSGLAYFFTASLRGLSSIPGHAMWTGLSGYAIGHALQRSAVARSAVQRSPFLTPDPEANWVLYDRDGRPTASTGWASDPSARMEALLRRHERHAWRMPTEPWAGVGLAMLGHALWNGSSWGVGRALSNTDAGLALMLELAWLVLMVVALWFCILRWLPTAVLGENPRLRSP